MQNKFEILKSEFITSDYNKKKDYIHWSRIYEWKYVLDIVDNYKPLSIHNTACGGLNENDCLHLTFCDDLERLCSDVTHSDLWGGNYPGTKTKPNKNNFVFYDITQPKTETYDMVLNISTIEHLYPGSIEVSLNNLWNQVKTGGHLILSFDYPDIDINLIERFFNLKIEKRENIISNGLLSVVLVHLLKL